MVDVMGRKFKPYSPERGEEWELPTFDEEKAQECRRCRGDYLVFNEILQEDICPSCGWPVDC